MNMRRRVLQAGIVGLAGVLAGGLAQAGQLDALAEYYRSAETVQGVFEQETIDERGDVIETSQGEFVIARPDRFRWSYEGPFAQEIVGDGERLWIHDVELDQVSVRDQRAALGSAPAQLLSGNLDDLEAAFELEETPEHVRLTPRDGGETFDEARVAMADGRPEVLEIDDALGQVTRVRLSEVRLDEPVEEERLRFEPPEGVDVYEMDREGAGP